MGAGSTVPAVPQPAATTKQLAKSSTVPPSPTPTAGATTRRQQQPQRKHTWPPQLPQQPATTTTTGASSSSAGSKPAAVMEVVALERLTLRMRVATQPIRTPALFLAPVQAELEVPPGAKLYVHTSVTPQYDLRLGRWCVAVSASKPRPSVAKDAQGAKQVCMLLWCGFSLSGASIRLAMCALACVLVLPLCCVLSASGDAALRRFPKRQSLRESMASHVCAPQKRTTQRRGVVFIGRLRTHTP